MSRPTFFSLLATLFAFVICANAEDAWKSKDPAQWSDQDVNQILNDSPWSKQAAVFGDRSGEDQGGRSRGRMGGGGVGFPGGGPGVGGYPGAGNPGGGGYPRGGGYPGGGGYPTGDEYPRGGSRGGGEGAAKQFTATVRWESALPVQQALSRTHGDQGAEKSESAAGQSAKQYVIGVIGLPITSARFRRADSDDSDSDSADSGRPRGRDPEIVREELMESTQLVRKGKPALRPTDVKINPKDAPGEVRFFFPAEERIDLSDKEVSFETQVGPSKLEKKFKLKDMTYQGKLEL
jgi:hypothetical protein